jgi:hypothetical protein
MADLNCSLICSHCQFDMRRGMCLAPPLSIVKTSPVQYTFHVSSRNSTRNNGRPDSGCVNYKPQFSQNSFAHARLHRNDSRHRPSNLTSSEAAQTRHKNPLNSLTFPHNFHTARSPYVPTLALGSVRVEVEPAECLAEVVVLSKIIDQHITGEQCTRETLPSDQSSPPTSSFKKRLD